MKDRQGKDIEGMMWMLGRLLLRHEDQMGIDKTENALVPRYEVRPCMLALYFLGETSKVFRLVKTSKVFARKHRRCFR